MVKRDKKLSFFFSLYINYMFFGKIYYIYMYEKNCFEARGVRQNP